MRLGFLRFTGYKQVYQLTSNDLMMSLTKKNSHINKRYPDLLFGEISTVSLFP